MILRKRTCNTKEKRLPLTEKTNYDVSEKRNISTVKKSKKLPSIQNEVNHFITKSPKSDLNVKVHLSSDKCPISNTKRKKEKTNYNASEKRSPSTVKKSKKWPPIESKVNHFTTNHSKLDISVKAHLSNHKLPITIRQKEEETISNSTSLHASNLRNKIKHLIEDDPKLGFETTVELYKRKKGAGRPSKKLTTPLTKISVSTSNAKLLQTSNIQNKIEKLIKDDPKLGFETRVELYKRKRGRPSKKLTTPLTKISVSTSNATSLQASCIQDKIEKLIKDDPQLGFKTSVKLYKHEKEPKRKLTTTQTKISIQHSAKMAKNPNITSLQTLKEKPKRKTARKCNLNDEHTVNVKLGFSSSKSNTNLLNVSQDPSKHVPVYLKNTLGSPEGQKSDPFEFIPEQPGKTKKKINKNNYKTRTNTRQLRHKSKIKVGGQKGTVKFVGSNTDNVSNNPVNVISTSQIRRVLNLPQSKSPLTNKKNIQRRIEAPADTSINTTVTEKKLLSPRLHSIQDISNIYTTTDDASINNEPLDDIDNNFGFDEEDEINFSVPTAQGLLREFTSSTSTPLPNFKSREVNRLSEHRNKVHVMSNILISPSSRNNPKAGRTNDCISSFKQKRQLLKTPVRSPWRTECLGIRRNPYFLFLKNGSLPCYNQEMVLDPGLIEKSGTKTPSHENSTQNTIVQSSMLDYININKTNTKKTPTKQSLSSTLFNESDFSPLRVGNSDKHDASEEEEDKENKTKSEKLNGKRNIFNTSPLKENNKNNKVSPNLNVRNFFGFDSSGEHDNSKTYGELKSRLRCKTNRPTRLNIKEVRQLIDNNEEQAEESQNERSDANLVSISNTSVQDESDVPFVGLFEDFEPERLHRSYDRKRLRRVKLNYSDENEEIIEEKPKRRRKDAMTEAEREQFNRWATEFNAMCGEVEKYNLETE